MLGKQHINVQKKKIQILRSNFKLTMINLINSNISLFKGKNSGEYR